VRLQALYRVAHAHRHGARCLHSGKAGLGREVRACSLGSTGVGGGRCTGQGVRV
jgi:hypothetical protein